MELKKLRRRVLMSSPHIEKPEGDIITFKTDMAKTLKKCEADIELVQSGTNDPSPTNIRPISGWTGMKLNHTGKNIVDVSHLTFVSGKYIDSDGSIGSNSLYLYCEDYIKVKPGSTYSVQYNKESSATVFTVALYTNDKDFIIRRMVVSSSQTHSGYNTGKFVTTDDTQYIRFSCHIDSTDIQIEEGDTATTYEPFGTVHEITFPAQGKNKISIDNTIGTALSRGITATKNNDGSITVKGTYTSSSNGFIGSVNDAVTLPAGEYVISGSTTGWYADYGVQLYINDTYGYVRGDPKTITLTEETSIPLRIHFVAANAKDVPLPAEGLTFYPMIRSASEPADYEPYNTVYGGTLDLLTGVLTVDKIGRIVTSVSASSSSGSGAYAYFVYGLSGMISLNKGISNLLEYCVQTIGYMKNNQFREVVLGNSDCVAFKINGTPSGDTVEERIASVNAQLSALAQAGTPLTFVSVLKNPRTYQLTPEQITALKGMNNIWADTGDTRIAYWTH